MRGREILMTPKRAAFVGDAKGLAIFNGKCPPCTWFIEGLADDHLSKYPSQEEGIRATFGIPDQVAEKTMLFVEKTGENTGIIYERAKAFTRVMELGGKPKKIPEKVWKVGWKVASKALELRGIGELGDVAYNLGAKYRGSILGSVTPACDQPNTLYHCVPADSKGNAAS